MRCFDRHGRTDSAPAPTACLAGPSVISLDALLLQNLTAQPGTQYTDLFANSVKPANRAGTISKALDFLEKWGFDG